MTLTINKKTYEAGELVAYIEELEKNWRTDHDTLTEYNNKLIKENADLEKAYNEVEELLDKQIEATYKVVEENKELKERLTYAKTIIQDLLENTDEYARQRAEDFLKENK